MNPIRGSRYPNTITNISGCSVVRSRKNGSSRLATRMSRLNSEKKIDDARTSARGAAIVAVVIQPAHIPHAASRIPPSSQLPPRQRHEQRLQTGLKQVDVRHGSPGVLRRLDERRQRLSAAIALHS